MKSEINTIEMSNIIRFKSVFDNEFCKQVSQEILEFKKNHQHRMPDANVGCWMGQPHKFDKFSQELQIEIADKILLCTQEYRKSLIVPTNIGTLSNEIFDKTKFHFNAWFNVNDPGSVNHPHSHPGNYISGVIWFQSTGTGSLEFMSHNYLYKLTHSTWPYHGTSKYEPADGDIVMFPSYILHQVNINTSNIQRISMAFDIKPEEKIR